ncbi:N-ethylmaleimide-sensitive fusion protein [Cavenderia fasciculata]|uniref:Vesicle-fusing ATPase n=1 Tax=Cavenderia fasciculata TaxID=261658 RepID=F4Q0E1_CACFS|nr:N-ethylmaleimide-sensitive fusion protein [Cavenderia fasciculata]EGG18292.1 N-ethylmaleimide-sensitive fusion protein [Cavenderia fasciculata]|eukprot:XP_004357115.1 N-ethylmaleimide-sensitive fusion protein [Cavenderia fasciculata]
METIYRLAVVAVPQDTDAYTNRVYINQQTFQELIQTGPSSKVSENGNYITLFTDNDRSKKVLSVSPSPKIPVGSIGVSKIHRNWMLLGLKEEVSVQYYSPEIKTIASITFKIDYFTRGKKGPKFDSKAIIAQISRDYNNQYFTEGQATLIQVRDNLEITVSDIKLSESDHPTNPPPYLSGSYGMLLSTSQILIQKAENSTIDIDVSLDGPQQTNQIFKQDWDFENMGIGGLDNEFRDIFRRAFASRIFPPAIVAKLGVQHVKGILLHGPPGTGKTLIARQIGKMLNGREPKIVSGPEVLGRYVGEPEENIRKLFKDAEIEYKSRGDDSALHIVIFDEIDSICKTRGTKTGDAGVNDSIVNQLLAKIEGVESLNNILIIGMTNRKDMIDEALLRPGRLEVHVEISLPDEHGRQQIFKIHTSKMQHNGLLAKDVSLDHLARVTKNYSGAEIEGVVKAATSYSFSRQVDTKNLRSVTLKVEDLNVCADDFERALKDIKPAFGQNDEQFRMYAINGIINYGPTFEKIQLSGNSFIQQVKNSSRTPLVSVLLSGKPGCGKSSLASTLAQSSDFPYVRTISPDDLVGYTESAKTSKITKIFEDSYRSPLSCIVVDDIERLIEFVPIGPRFSNSILQTLLILLKKTPPKGRKLLVLATSSVPEAVRDLGLGNCFATTLPIPSITTKDEFSKVVQELGVFGPSEVKRAAEECFDDTTPITIKQLIMAIEMARQEDSGSLIQNLKQSMVDFQLRDL